jgi:hypothetical protein
MIAFHLLANSFQICPEFYNTTEESVAAGIKNVCIKTEMPSMKNNQVKQIYLGRFISQTEIQT